MEGFCSTNQSPQWAVVPMEEEEGEVCMYVCMHVCMYVCVCVYIYIYICVCVCVCVCLWVSMYMYAGVCVCVLNDSHNTQRWKNIALCVSYDLNMLVYNVNHFNL